MHNDPRSGTSGEMACAREPIHRSGAIQPHGYLLSCTLPDWTVQQASANVADLLDMPASEVIGRSLREHVADEVLQPLLDVVDLLEPGAAPQRAAVGNIGAFARLCDISVHVANDLVHLELEPRAATPSMHAPTVVAQRMIARVSASTDMRGFHQRTAEEIRELTGYDRVMVYRFRLDDAGEVIAEACAEDMEPFLGMRYPASDIPLQARALYLRNRIRVIPDSSYRAVPIIPGVDAAGVPLDLSQHALRSVSPVHLEYLRNMGVAASMSISIVSGGRLWGLIACHHREPRPVPPSVRAAADMFSRFVSMRVAATEQAIASQQDDRARAGNVSDMRLFRRRHVIAEQKSRLDQLSTLLDGLGHLEDAQTARIGARIAELEAELRQLMMGNSVG